MQAETAVGVHRPLDGQHNAVCSRATMEPQRSLSLTYSTQSASEGGKGRAKRRSRLGRDGADLGVPPMNFPRSISADGLNLATDTSSAVGHIQLEDMYDAQDGAESSSLAPGPLHGRWTAIPDQMGGFDQQVSIQEVGDRSGRGCRRDSWDSWDSSIHGDGDDKRISLCGHQTTTVRDWKRVPGDTSITYGVRLYLSNLDPDISHEENCDTLLREILNRIATEELDVPALKMRHLIKIEAFLRSTVLGVPCSKSWQHSMKGAFALSAPMLHRKASGHYHQICKQELMFRMTLFVAMLGAERKASREADTGLDAMRVDSVVRAFVANAAELRPLQRPARKLLPPLLFCMACELLNVRLLGPELRGVSRQIVSDYEARAKLWMSPLQNAERYLRPLVLEFVKWLRRNRDTLYQESATEGLLSSIDENLRYSLKHQVYCSPEHFLSVMSSLKNKLTDTPLPPYDPSGGDDDHPFDVSQTVKDVRREKFHVNGAPTVPSECWPKIRAGLLRAAMGSPSDTRKCDVEESTSREKQISAMIGQPSHPIGIEGVYQGGHGSGGCIAGRSASQSYGDAAECLNDARNCNADARDGQGRQSSEPGGECREPRSGLEMYVDQCAWRVLHAASRTASGGDSFFVVQDLFGGDGVLVKSATTVTEPIKIRTKSLAVKVTTVDKYDIYHASDIDIHSGASDSSPRALITITTTMKEIIQFAPYREVPTKGQSSAASNGSNAGADNDEDAARMQPRHARSGRFITISAGLPEIDEDYISKTQEPSLKPDRHFGAGFADEGSGHGSGHMLDTISAGCTPSLRRSTSAPPRVSVGCFTRRPSTFSCPPPEGHRGGRQRQAGSSIDDAEAEAWTTSKVSLPKDDVAVK